MVVRVAFVGGEVDLFEGFGFVVFEAADLGWVSFGFLFLWEKGRGRVKLWCEEDVPIANWLKKMCLLSLARNESYWVLLRISR